MSKSKRSCKDIDSMNDTNELENRTETFFTSIETQRLQEKALQNTKNTFSQMLAHSKKLKNLKCI